MVPQEVIDSPKSKTVVAFPTSFQKLQETLAALLITKQIVGNCGEILGPTLISWAKVYLLRRHLTTDNKTGQEKLSQVETESEKPRYDSSFDDYLEMFIQVCGCWDVIQSRAFRIRSRKIAFIFQYNFVTIWNI